jgi:uncharacterized protein YqeY
MTISDIEQQLTAALKSRDTVTSSTLRLLLARVKNERIALGHELTDAEMLAVVQSEYKRRKEAAVEFEKGGRQEAAQSELAEGEILSRFLPEQVSESDIATAVAELQVAHNWTAKDFGAAMKVLKDKFGAAAEGGVLAKVLKEKLI